MMLSKILLNLPYYQHFHRQQAETVNSYLNPELFKAYAQCAARGTPSTLLARPSVDQCMRPELTEGIDVIGLQLPLLILDLKDVALAHVEGDE